MTTKMPKTPKKPPKPDAQAPINHRAIELLRSWRDVGEADAQEQRETMQYLRKALDEGRPDGLKHFP